MTESYDGETCRKCGASLNEEYAVVRRYVAGRGRAAITCDGHYDRRDGTFVLEREIMVPDEYDCRDDSDSCAACGKKI